MLTFLDLGKYGRLGNQMFQIASTIGLGVENGHSICFPVWPYSDFFKNPMSQDENLSQKYFFIPIIEKGTRYREYVISSIGDYNLSGYFQSWKYFDQHRDLIKFFFEPKVETIPANHNKVAVHIRRGDYIDLQHVHVNLWEDGYYHKAFEFFGDKTFNIFSDDISWCIDTLPDEFPDLDFHFIDPYRDINDLFYLSSFKNMIISNSSFSWWAAYLNKWDDPNIVAPDVWVTTEDTVEDRILPEWTIL